MSLPFLLSALLLLLFVIVVRERRRFCSRLPGPKGFPFIGNLHQINKITPHIYLSKLAKTYGPILSLRLGFTPTVVIQSAKLAKEVLKTQDQNFCSRPPLVGRQKLSYNGLDIAFAPYSAYSRQMKKISVVHLFNSQRVQSFAPIRRDEIFKMINNISSLASASSGNVVNLSDMSMAVTNSIICRISFGKRYDDEEGIKRSKFHDLLNDVQEMLVAFFFSDYFPSIGWALDKLTGLSSKLEKVFKDLDVFLEEIINEHIHGNKLKSKCDREDIIDVLLQLREEDNFVFELTLNHIKAVLMNIFVAGSDTSSAMMVWAMTALVKNPMVMNKVQNELRTLLKGKNFIEEDDIPKLEYFTAVVKETFRLHPAAPLLVRQAMNTCNIEGYEIRPRTLVYVNTWAIARDPAIWEDPELFKPERFLKSSKNLVDFKGQNFEFLPFGSGRRMCPGMNLGVGMFEVALANLLYSFDWELPDGMKKDDIDFDVIPGLTPHKKNPLCLIARNYVPLNL